MLLRNQNNLAPIALFVYNRPDHTRRTVEALLKNDLSAQSVLYAFSDAPANDSARAGVAAVRDYLKTVSGFAQVHVIEREKNLGLIGAITGGVTEVVNRHGRVIVVEDDIVTSPHFLRYMNDALDLYENEPRVMHVSAFMFPVKGDWDETFFYNTTSCWGWATWQRAWDNYNPDAAALLAEIESRGALNRFDIDGACRSFSDQLRQNAAGSMKTWAIKWYASVFLQGGLSLHPKYSLVRNIGFDGSGVNSTVTNHYDQESSSRPVAVESIELKEDPLVRAAMWAFYRQSRPSQLRLLFNNFKQIGARAVSFLEPWSISIRIASLYRKYSYFTMIPAAIFRENLSLAWRQRRIAGAVVECGVWRGGMIAALAELLGEKRAYYLFDSFEGLPPAQEEDGKAALDYQQDKLASNYFDNCRADISFAEKAMSLSGAKEVKIVKGWFSETLPAFRSDQAIAILRLDGDWYASTMDCLNGLYHHVAPGGLIIIDDYYTWGGCRRAVDEFLASKNPRDEVKRSRRGVAYIVKN